MYFETDLFLFDVPFPVFSKAVCHWITVVAWSWQLWYWNAGDGYV